MIYQDVSRGLNVAILSFILTVAHMTGSPISSLVWGAVTLEWFNSTVHFGVVQDVLLLSAPALGCKTSPGPPRTTTWDTGALRRDISGLLFGYLGGQGRWRGVQRTRKQMTVAQGLDPSLA